MKGTVQIVRVLVGLLFIVSGLVKANDPLGLSYKMKEFFEVWNAGLTASNFFLKDFLINTFQTMHGYTLSISVIMITLEIVAGIALLIGWKRKFVLNLLLALILFFTFLTGYAYWSGKFKDCGCFGDCLPITPLSSFLKDVLLLLAILFLIRYHKYIQPLFTSTARNIILASSLVLSIGLQWYVLQYLPIVDCLPFKKGNNLVKEMKPPPNAVPDSFAIRFIYEKGGKEFEFSPNNLPADLDSYTFKDRIDKLVRKGNADPKIRGFSLTTLSGIDSTGYILNNPGYIILYFTNKGDEEKHKEELNHFFRTAYQKSINVFAVTSNVNEVQQLFQKMNWPIQLLKTDVTAFRTAARANPTIYLLNNGTVVEKWTLQQLDDVTQTITTLN